MGYKYKIKEAGSPEFKVGDIEINRGVKTKITDIDPRTGAITWDIDYLPNLDILVEDSADLVVTAKGVYQKAKDDRKFLDIYEQAKRLRNSIRTHVRNNYPEDYKKAMREGNKINEVSFDDVLDLRADKKDLEDRIAQVYREMEQEAEPEGGPIADQYADALHKLEDKLHRVMKQINDYDMNETSMSGAAGAYLTPYAFKIPKKKKKLKEQQKIMLSPEDKKKFADELTDANHDVNQQDFDTIAQYKSARKSAEKKVRDKWAPNLKESGIYDLTSFHGGLKNKTSEEDEIKNMSDEELKGEISKIDSTDYKGYGRSAKLRSSIMKGELKKRGNIKEDSQVKISEPRFIKDKNNPNFLNVYIDYSTGPGGASIALGKETMTGQIRRKSAAAAVDKLNNIAKDLTSKYDVEDIEVTDLENGKAQLFAVSDDFIDGIKEGVGATLGPGPAAGPDGVKDNAYVKQFKYQLVPKNKQGTYVQKGSTLLVRKLWEKA